MAKKPGEEWTNNAQTTGGSDEWQSPLGPGLLTVRFGPDLAGMEKLGATKSWGILFKEKNDVLIIYPEEMTNLATQWNEQNQTYKWP